MREHDMRIERTPAWWLAKAYREGDTEVGAGALAFDPVYEGDAASVDEIRIAFGRLVNLLRRQRGLSIEKLAEEATLDVGELVSIEDDLRYVPEPRTIYQLAQTFHVSQKSLMQLAGLTMARDTSLRQEAVRFAARSESVQALTADERVALEAFVAVLSRRTSDS
jgi:transcriptional regulator with XRE-family HTH domain